MISNLRDLAIERIACRNAYLVLVITLITLLALATVSVCIRSMQHWHVGAFSVMNHIYLLPLPGRDHQAHPLPEGRMTSPTTARITARIRTLRADASLTQQDLADRIGVTRQTVNAIEGDTYSPSLELAFRIVRVFDIPLEKVFQYVQLKT